jgi:hypothetical protein
VLGDQVRPRPLERDELRANGTHAELIVGDVLFHAECLKIKDTGPCSRSESLEAVANRDGKVRLDVRRMAEGQEWRRLNLIDWGHGLLGRPVLDERKVRAEEERRVGPVRRLIVGVVHDWASCEPPVAQEVAQLAAERNAVVPVGLWLIGAEEENSLLPRDLLRSVGLVGVGRSYRLPMPRWRCCAVRARAGCASCRCVLAHLRRGGTHTSVTYKVNF